MIQHEIHQHAVFRVLLQAMSRPGQAFDLPEQTGDDPRRHLRAVVTALCDHESPCHLADDNEDMAFFLIHDTGCPHVPVEDAHFLVVPRGSSHGLIERLPRGTPDFPDRGATVIYQVLDFAGEGPRPLLSGPGIAGSIRPTLAGLNPSELRGLAAINHDFPLGVDAFFVSWRGQVMGLPRSTIIGG